RTPRAALVVCHRRQPRNWPVDQRPDRSRHPGGRHLSLPDFHQAVIFASHMAASPPGIHFAARGADPRTVVYPSDAAQPALPRLHSAQWSGALSRVFLVLLHQRALAPFSEPALSARLQYRPALAVLAVAPGVAVSLERIFSGGDPPQLSA